MEINIQLTEEEQKINLGGFPPIFKITNELCEKRRVPDCKIIGQIFKLFEILNN